MTIGDAIAWACFGIMIFFIVDYRAFLAAPDEFKIRGWAAIPGGGIAAWAAGRLSRRSRR